MGIKLILDTDIGTDVDDAWALALCLASPEIELLGITLVHADLETRARISLKMLRLAGRTDIPVFKGLSHTLTPGKRLVWQGHEGADTDFSDIAGLQASEGAVDFILDTVNRYPGEVIVSPIGPLTNVAEAIRREPDVAAKIRRFVIMGTNYVGDGVEPAAFEHNCCLDPVATKVVLESGIPATVVGLNVSKKVCVRRDEVRKLEGTPLGNYLAAMTYQYYSLIGRDYTWMHDPLAVSTIIDPSFVSFQPMRAQVLEDGRVAYFGNPSGPLCVSVDVRPEPFEVLLLERVGQLVRSSA